MDRAGKAIYRELISICFAFRLDHNSLSVRVFLENDCTDITAYITISYAARLIPWLSVP